MNLDAFIPMYGVLLMQKLTHKTLDIIRYKTCLSGLSFEERRLPLNPVLG